MDHVKVCEGLRHSPKGQLQYNRNLEGKSFMDLLQLCSTVPMLSCGHIETSPPPQTLDSARFGLDGSEIPQTHASVDTNKETGVLGDHDYCNESEKGSKDCSVVERPSLGLSDSRVLSSPLPDKVVEESRHDGGRSIEKRKSPAQNGKISPETLSRTSENMKDKSNPATTSVKQNNGTREGRNEIKQSPRSPRETDCRTSDRDQTDELTVQFMEKLRALSEENNKWDNKSREVIERKMKDFMKHQKRLDSEHDLRLSAVQQQQLQQQKSQRNLVEKLHQSKKSEIHQDLQKVLDSHEQCQRRQGGRLEQVKQLAVQLKEKQIKREQEQEQKLEELRALAQSIGGIRTQLSAALDACPHKQHLPETAERTRGLLRKLCEQAEDLLRGLDRTGPLEERSGRLNHLHQQSQNAFDFVNGLIAEAEKKAKAAALEAEKQKQAAQTVQQQTPASQAQSPTTPTATTAQPSVGEGSLGALSAVATAFEENSKLLAQTQAALQPFVQDPQMKKLRFDLQRAVNTPINAISPVSAAHLRDKLLRLQCLLKGMGVEVVGKQVSARAAPQGTLFCTNLTARMIARKADEQVSSNHESAFAIAAVAVGLWKEIPELGALLMSHLQALCPYILPFYPPRLPNQSSADYHRSLGYKVDDDGTVEQQDKFLRRMSGIMRLYAAILVTSPPQGASHPHPHGLKHAWEWLTRTLNLEPNPDITATAIYDMLQVTGHFLLKAYRVQFAKLLYCLSKVFLPKLKDVAAATGPVTRLQTFLESTLRNNAFIPEPEGYLPARFWAH